MTTREIYRVTIFPGNNVEKAAIRLARLIVNRWMPDNAGGVHLFVTPKMSEWLVQFFKREKSTVIEIDTNGTVPVLTEVK